MRLTKHVDPKPFLYYGAAFLIPFCLLWFCIYYLKYTPFGEDSLLFVDSATQYVNYLSYFKSILSGENNLLYTFSKNLGGDMLSLAAYYLLSPFNLLFHFASTKTLPLVYTLIMTLKLSACGLSYAHAAGQIWKKQPVNLAFSTAYALMGYNVIYEWNIMWLDAVILLPLLFLGLYRLWQGKRSCLYSVVLFLALLTSFYTGYMLCGFALIVCLAMLALHPGSSREKSRFAGRFVLHSCVGGFCSAFSWLPAFLSLSGNRLDTTGDGLSFYYKLEWERFCAKFVTGAADVTEIYYGMPHVFCGSLVVLLVLAYFLNRSVSGKKRITALVLMGIFLASFAINTFDVVWHGFSPNRLFNYRYSFLFSFLLILIAQDSWANREGLSRAGLLISAALSGILFLAGIPGWQELVTNTGLFISLAVLAVSLAVLWLPKLPGKAAAWVLLVCTLAQMGLNCGICWNRMFDGSIKLNYPDYVGFLDFAQPAVEYTKALDDGFHRIEKTFQRDQNDPMLFAYNGLSHFSSTEKAYVMKFQETMGFRNYYDIWSYYGAGSTAEVDALLGVKYMMSLTPLPESKHYTHLTSINDIHIYENPNALPIAMLAQPELKSVNLEGLDYFAAHNAIWSGLTGTTAELLLKETNYSVTLTNLTEETQEDGSRLYTKIDPNSPASLRFDVVISREMPLFFYFTAPVIDRPIPLYINGESNGVYFDAYRWDMAHAGTYTPGQTVSIELIPEVDSFPLTDAWFYYEDAEALNTAAARILPQDITLEKRSSSHLRGSFTAEEGQQLFLTIPYEEGWHLSVDGKATALEPILGTFLSASVEEGTHNFDLYYISRGMIPGFALALTAGGSVLIWQLLCLRRKKKEK